MEAIFQHFEDERARRRAEEQERQEMARAKELLEIETLRHEHAEMRAILSAKEEAFSPDPAPEPAPARRRASGDPRVSEAVVVSKTALAEPVAESCMQAVEQELTVGSKLLCKSQRINARVTYAHGTVERSVQP